MTTWTDFYNSIIQVLDGKAELIVTPEQALRVMTLIDSIFLAARKGRLYPAEYNTFKEQLLIIYIIGT